jgi:hypothetical protein
MPQPPGGEELKPGKDAVPQDFNLSVFLTGATGEKLDNMAPNLLKFSDIFFLKGEAG